MPCDVQRRSRERIDEAAGDYKNATQEAVSLANRATCDAAETDFAAISAAWTRVSAALDRYMQVVHDVHQLDDDLRHDHGSRVGEMPQHVAKSRTQIGHGASHSQRISHINQH